MAYEIMDGRVQTRALECHIVDHCNLRCDHCCSFSPILKKWFADAGTFERDLRAAKQFVAPEFLKIVGGEPLLHPEIERLLEIAHDVRIGPRIQLTTNALLIDRLTPRGWDCLSMLSVSLYPEPALPNAVIRSIAREARERGIEVSWKVQDRFTCLDRETTSSYAEAKRVFNGCWIRHRCNTIKNGRFYCCTRPQYVQKFAADADSFLDDGVEIESGALRIQQHLRQEEPLRSCFLCNGGNAALETNRQLHPLQVKAKRENLVRISEQIATHTI